MTEFVLQLVGVVLCPAIDNPTSAAMSFIVVLWIRGDRCSVQRVALAAVYASWSASHGHISPKTARRKERMG
jgi:hypothetical protein